MAYKIIFSLFLSLSIVLITLCPAGANPARFKRQWIWDEQTPTPVISSSTSTSTSPPINVLDPACENLCLRATTNEYNLVCGSNDVTYVNPNKLKCAARCGLVNLVLAYYGPCV